MAAYVLNLADMCCTLLALRLGVGVELNPLMSCVPVMAAYKIVIVGALFWWLSSRKEALARLGLELCTTVYAGLAAYHAAGLVTALML